jgi:hypothetical protein
MNSTQIGEHHPGNDGRHTKGSQHDGPREAASQDEFVQYHRHTQSRKELQTYPQPGEPQRIAEGQCELAILY